MKYEEKSKMLKDLDIKYRNLIHKEVQGMWCSISDYSDGIKLDGDTDVKGLRFIADTLEQYLKEREPIQQIKTED